MEYWALSSELMKSYYNARKPIRMKSLRFPCSTSRTQTAKTHQGLYFPQKSDVVLFFLLCIAGFSGSYIGSEQINSRAVKAGNVWFQADIGRVYANMTDRNSNHYRTKVHPIFSLATNPVVWALHKAGLQKQNAVRIIVSAIAGIWLALIYLVLRLLYLRYLDALLFSVLAAASASAFFWTTVPETYLFGSLSMLIVMAFVAVSEKRTFHSSWHVSISALALSMTVTNWMTGIFATIVNNSYRRSILITLGALLLITALWAFQNEIYPSSEFFIGDTEELNYVLPEIAGGVTEKAIVFFVYTMIMPAIQVLENPYAAEWPLLTIQHVTIGSTGLLSWAMTVIWITLLMFGAWMAFRIPKQRKFKIVLGLTIVGQLSLHLLYGEETFLYSLHWIPFLVLLAAIGTHSSYRHHILATIVVLIVGVSINNYQQFTAVTAVLNNEKYGLSKEEQKRSPDKQLYFSVKAANSMIVMI